MAYHGTMGRGQQSTTPSKQFAAVMGVRRGSSAAQRDRDLQELEIALRPVATARTPLSFELLGPLAPHAQKKDSETRGALIGALAANISTHGLDVLGPLLGAETPSKAMKKRLREAIATYLSMDEVDLAKRREEADHLLGHLFLSDQEEDYLAANGSLIMPIGRVFSGPSDRSSSCLPLLRALVHQGAGRLFSLYQPWIKVLTQEVRTGHCAPVLEEIERALLEGIHDEPYMRADALEGLRRAVQRAMKLTDMQLSVLLHPAWDNGPVTKHDILSERATDGLPRDLKSAQRVLCSLNGGRRGDGVQYTEWMPSLRKDTRFCYAINDRGRSLRAAGQRPLPSGVVPGS